MPLISSENPLLDLTKHLVRPGDPGYVDMEAEKEFRLWDEMERMANIPPEEDPAFIKQLASQIHTVFRVDGEIVATTGYETGVTSLSHFPGLGMIGDDDDWRKSAEKGLYAEYGAALEIEHYPPGAGPTVGETHDEMFKRGPRVPPPEAYAKSSDRSSTASAGGRTISPVDFSAQMLEILQEQWRR